MSNKSLPYIDIHTHHRQESGTGTVRVHNLLLYEAVDLTGMRCCTIGLHPWHVSRQPFDQSLLRMLASSPAVIGIGETGLDRLRDSDIASQAAVFIGHLDIAEDLGKPVIIHCVKAWEEMIRLKGSRKSMVPWIIHGFRGKEELAAQLIRHGFYLSFGADLLKEATSLPGIFRTVPDDRIFLETDESEVTPSELYRAASLIRAIPTEDLKKIIHANFLEVFGSDAASRMA